MALLTIWRLLSECIFYTIDLQVLAPVRFTIIGRRRLVLLKRVSVLLSVFLTACVPSFRFPAPPTPEASNCQNTPPSAAESADWSRAQRLNTRESYRAFLARYPRSCYAGTAVSRMKTTVQKQPVAVRNLPVKYRRTWSGRTAY